MKKLGHVLGDTVDDSLEMPEGYGSRSVWRYYQVKALIGLACAPILMGLSFIDADTTIGRIVWIAGFVATAATAIFLIRRDARVQKRIDETGSPLVEREPY